MTVIDEISSKTESRKSSQKTTYNEFDFLSGNDLETIVLRIIKDDPFNTIGEIKQQLRGHALFDDVGWWKIFFLLKKGRLLSKRSRFRFARRRH